MSLVTSKRDPSDIQYYHTCLQLHRQIAQAIKQDFGLSQKKRNENAFLLSYSKAEFKKLSDLLVYNVQLVIQIEKITSKRQFADKQSFQTQAISICWTLLTQFSLNLDELQVKPSKYVDLLELLQKQIENLERQKADDKIETRSG